MKGLVASSRGETVETVEMDELNEGSNRTTLTDEEETDGGWRERGDDELIPVAVDAEALERHEMEEVDVDDQVEALQETAQLGRELQKVDLRERWKGAGGCGIGRRASNDDQGESSSYRWNQRASSATSATSARRSDAARKWARGAPSALGRRPGRKR